MITKYKVKIFFVEKKSVHLQFTQECQKAEIIRRILKDIMSLASPSVWGKVGKDRVFRFWLY